MLAKAAAELGASKTAPRLVALHDLLKNPLTNATIAAAAKNEAKAATLAMAKRVGKARFAQAASKHTDLATELPNYIRQSVEWLTS